MSILSSILIAIMSICLFINGMYGWLIVPLILGIGLSLFEYLDFED